MLQVCGSIEKLSPGTFFWNLKNETKMMAKTVIFYSKEFSMCDEHEKDKYNVRFRRKADFGIWVFYIYCSERFSLEFDLCVEVHYTDKSLERSFKNFQLNKKLNVIASGIRGFGQLGVTCNVSNIRVTKKGLNNSGGNNIQTKDAGSSKTHQDKKMVNAEVKEHANITGLLALSRNFQDVFLDKEESDIIFNVGDQKYPAHKIIIRARSPVFYAMLKNDMREKSEGFVNISDCDPYLFKDFLLYLYTGKIDNVSNINACELYYMSDKYDVKELKTDCIEFISSNLNVDIICDVITLATRHCERDLLSKATAFFVENAKNILLTVKWQKFVKENPVEANELFIKILNKISEK